MTGVIPDVARRSPRRLTTIPPETTGGCGRSPGSRSCPAEPSQPLSGQWHISAICTAYSCGGSHGIAPFQGGAPRSLLIPSGKAGTRTTRVRYHAAITLSIASLKVARCGSSRGCCKRRDSDASRPHKHRRVSARGAARSGTPQMRDLPARNYGPGSAARTSCCAAPGTRVRSKERRERAPLRASRSDARNAKESARNRADSRLLA